MENQTPEQARAAVEALAAELQLTATWQFVPFSQSRNAATEWQSLNWRYTLLRNGREVLKGDYAQGIAHIPLYEKVQSKYGKTGQARPYFAKVCEKGKFATTEKGVTMGLGLNDLPPPALADLLYSLVMDSSVLESGGFEDWAAEFGYDSDSRKAESIYRECLETALKLQAAIGAAKLAELREAANGF